MKKIVLFAVCFLLTVLNMSTIHAENVYDEPSKTFIEFVDLVYSKDSKYSVHNKYDNITSLFKDENQQAYESGDYDKIQNYFINNGLHVLGETETEVEKDSKVTRGVQSTTYSRKTPFYTMLVSKGGVTAEFAATVRCKATYDDRTGKAVDVYAPYFQVTIAPGTMTLKLSTSQYTSGTYAYYTIHNFTASAFNMSGMVGATVEYNTVYCNLSDSFQPVAV